MSMVIASSFAAAHCEAAWRFLETAGLRSPVGAGINSHDMAELGDRLQAAHLKGRKNRFAMINPARIGRAWQLVAGDVVIANAHQQHWGWSEPDVLPFLDFWSEFEPDCRFAFFYTEPAIAISAAVRPSQPHRGDQDGLRSEFETAAARWAQYSDAVIRYYSLNAQRCVLINLGAVHARSFRLARSLSTKLDLSLAGSSDPDGGLEPASPIYALLNTTLTGGSGTAANSLFEQLETLADCPGPPAGNRQLDHTAMVAEHFDVVRRVEELSDEVSALKSEIGLVRDQAENRQAALSGELERQKADNELLELQLDQAHEELEFQLTKQQNCDGQSVPKIRESDTPTPEEGPSARRIDLRHFIEGANWHDPEHAGRWAGPGTCSTIRLPRLAEGRYRIVIAVVDAMSRQIFDRMTVLIGSHRLRFRRRLRTNATGTLAGLRRLRPRLHPSSSPFPAELEARILVDRQAEPRDLVLEFPTALSPSEHGAPDIRKLTARLSHIDIERL